LEKNGPKISIRLVSRKAFALPVAHPPKFQKGGIVHERAKEQEIFLTLAAKMVWVTFSVQGGIM